MAADTRDTRGRDDRNLQVTAALGLGALLALVGIIGPLLGGQEGVVLGLGRNYLHDAVHLLSGLAGLAAGYYAGGRFAEEYNKALGVGYLLVVVLGFVAFDLMAELINLNMADNFFHLGLTIPFLAVGFYLDRER